MQFVVLFFAFRVTDTFSFSFNSIFFFSCRNFPNLQPLNVDKKAMFKTNDTVREKPCSKTARCTSTSNSIPSYNKPCTVSTNLCVRLPSRFVGNLVINKPKVYSSVVKVCVLSSFFPHFFFSPFFFCFAGRLYNFVTLWWFCSLWLRLRINAASMERCSYRRFGMFSFHAHLSHNLLMSCHRLPPAGSG